MTEITLNREGARRTLAARGHAAGSGKVCAGVSAVVYALAGYLANRDAEVRDWRLEPGDALLDFMAREEGERAAFEMARIGLLQIARSYPEFVRVEEGGGA